MIRLLACILATFLPCAAWGADSASTLRDYIPGGAVSRFEGPVDYWIGGEDRLEGQYYIDTVMNELRRILPEQSFRQVSSPSRAGIRFFLTDSLEEWRDAVTASAEGASGWEEIGDLIRGCTRVVSSPSGAIRRADIILHLDFQTSGGQKLWIVRHEMMHALGITNHPMNQPDSVLNSRQPQEDKNGRFSDADILVLQTVYGQ